MAERILIAELDIDVNGVVEEQKNLGQEIAKLKEQLKLAKKEGTEYTEENIRASAQLRNLTQQYNANQRIVQGLTETQNKNNLTIAQARRLRNALTAEYERSVSVYGQNDERTRRLSESLAQLNTRINTSSQNVNRHTDNIGNYTNSINNAIMALPLFGGGLGRAASALRRFNLTILASPLGWILGLLGLVTAALGSLAAHFKSSEEGQKDYNEITSATNVILGNLSDVAADSGKSLLEMIKNPLIQLERFRNFLSNMVNFFKNTFGQAIIGQVELVGLEFKRFFSLVGLGWNELKDLFIDNTEGVELASEKLDKLQKDIADSQQKRNQGVKNFFETSEAAARKANDSFKRFAEENIKETKEAIKLANIQLETDRLERKQLVEKAKVEAEVAELRLKSRQEDRFTAAERIEFLIQANELQDRLLSTDVKIADNRLKLRQIQNSFSKSTKENLDEEARLEANLFNVQTARLNQSRQIQRELNTISKQDLAQRKKEADQQIKLLEDILRGVDEYLAQEEMIRYQNAENRLLAQKNNADREYELQIFNLDRKRKAELYEAEQTGADVAAIKDKYAQLEIDIERKKELAKYSAIAAFSGAVGALLDQNTLAAKAAAIAQTLINTYMGAMAAFAQTPGPIWVKGIAAGAATATGLANLAKIKQVNTKSSSTSAPSLTTVSGASESSFSSSAFSGNVIAPQGQASTDFTSSIVTGGSSLASNSTKQIEKSFETALENQPPVLVLEDFEATNQRKVNVENEASQL